MNAVPDPSGAPDAADAADAPVVLLDEIPAAGGGARFAVATLNAPRTLNALSLAMVQALDGALQEWAQDPGIAGVLLQGAGEKAFCAGGDLLQLHRSIRDANGGPNPHAAAFFEQEYRLDHRIHAYPKPVLAWGHGIVMGGGIGLLAGASHRVATEASRWAMPEIAIGLFPDVGGSWFLRRMPGRTGLFLALTGAPLNASDARFAGLADVRIAQAQKDDVLDAIAATRWQGDAPADRAELSRLLHRHQAPPADRDAWPLSRLRSHYDTIESLMAGEDLRDIADRLRALETDDSWLAAAAAGFARGSPTSAALAFALWQRVPRLSLAEVFRLEYHAALACCAHHDFPEGIRALLLDKDRAPRWEPAGLEQIPAALVADHFRPRHASPHPLADLRD
jgi:enoyl-CoA hydratase/carnithine racemase